MSISLFAMKTFDHIHLIHVFPRVIGVIERPCCVKTHALGTSKRLKTNAQRLSLDRLST